jgi:hypothetical protein
VTLGREDGQDEQQRIHDDQPDQVLSAGRLGEKRGFLAVKPARREQAHDAFNHRQQSGGN